MRNKASRHLHTVGIGSFRNHYVTMAGCAKVYSHLSFKALHNIQSLFWPTTKRQNSIYYTISFQRPVRAFKSIATQTRVPLRTPAHQKRPSSQTCRPLSSQGNGDGEGDPKGEKPQEQCSSTSAHHKSEHPGPAPPAEGNKTGGATKATSDSSSGTKNPSEASA